MTDRHRKQWEALGATDPYWAVLTHADKKGGRWDKAAFFETGVQEIKSLEETLARLGTNHARTVALDYGCGVGRLSRALAAGYGRVIGVDISESMLVEARAANAAVPNIDFVRGNGRDLRGLVEDRSVDLVYSNIVLQHSPAVNQRSLIREFCRVVAPGGVIVFQTPSHANTRTVKGVVHRVLGNRLLNIPRRIVYGKAGVMELHTLDKDEVVRILGACGMTVLATERYDSAGPAFVGYLYVAAKR
jgi:ubiquinone/menaquinone biosynthesis C-methylase UbiE